MTQSCSWWFQFIEVYIFSMFVLQYASHLLQTIVTYVTHSLCISVAVDFEVLPDEKTFLLLTTRSNTNEAVYWISLFQLRIKRALKPLKARLAFLNELSNDIFKLSFFNNSFFGSGLFISTRIRSLDNLSRSRLNRYKQIRYKWYENSEP